MRHLTQKLGFLFFQIDEPLPQPVEPLPHHGNVARPTQPDRTREQAIPQPLDRSAQFAQRMTDQQGEHDCCQNRQRHLYRRDADDGPARAFAAPLDRQHFLIDDRAALVENALRGCPHHIELIADGSDIAGGDVGRLEPRRDASLLLPEYLQLGRERGRAREGRQRIGARQKRSAGAQIGLHEYRIADRQKLQGAALHDRDLLHQHAAVLGGANGIEDGGPSLRQEPLERSDGDKDREDGRDQDDDITDQDQSDDGARLVEKPASHGSSPGAPNGNSTLPSSAGLPQ